jgi:hypothetical protein
LLRDYVVGLQRPLHRRNVAFHSAVAMASGIPLELDGDLVRTGAAPDNLGSTELAVRSLAKELGMGDAGIRREQGDNPEFERSPLYRKVFEFAERIEGRPLPRAVLPNIALRSPKITRKGTTARARSPGRLILAPPDIRPWPPKPATTNGPEPITVCRLERTAGRYSGNRRADAGRNMPPRRRRPRADRRSVRRRTEVRAQARHPECQRSIQSCREVKMP